MSTGITETSDTIVGATDGTEIGNVGDRLKVDIRDSIIPDEISIIKIARLLNGSSPDMAVNASVTPVNFDYSPASGETWVIDSIVVLIGGNGDLRSTYFGNITGGLTNGVVLKIKTNGTEYTIDTLKNNKNLVQCFHHDQIIGDSGTNLFRDVGGRFYTGELPFEGRIKLQNSTSDYIRMTIQDDLTSLAFFEASVTIRRVI